MPTSRQRFLEIIHRHSTRMERLVKDLLRLARLDAGQETAGVGRVRRRARSSSSLVADFEAARQRQAAAAARRTSRPRRRTLVVDPAKLHDILRNLVENAINYTPDGGTIDIAATIGRRPAIG